MSAEFRIALDLLEGHPGHLFVTGKAGTGKSTLLRLWRDRTKLRIVVLAPTGIAALNVLGQTVHSFFGFGPAETVSSVRRWSHEIPPSDKYRKLDAIVIDEASMLRADLVDCMDAFLRRQGPRPGEPFGGVRVVFFGDLFQLPPVVTDREREALSRAYATPYFFSAHAFTGIIAAPIRTVCLTKSYRQRDAGFLGVLDAIRTGTATAAHFAVLAARHQPNFEPPAAGKGELPDGDFWIRLTTTNARAKEINDVQLAGLRGRTRKFKARFARQRPEGMSLPTEETLSLKKGAQVMFVANDPERRWVNGTVGRVVGFGADDLADTVVVALPDGEEVEVGPHSWEMYDWQFDADAGSMVTESVGQFIQHPLRLAWAVTIHKSQGQTFDRLVLDLGRGTFAAGQLYVALSRCRTLGGIVLKQVVTRRHMLVDSHVREFVERGTVTSAVADPAAAREIRSVLTAAIEDQRAVRILYRKPGTDAEWRTVTPLSLGGMEYESTEFSGLKAYCHRSQGQRTFRLDRIEKTEVPEE